MPSEKRIKQIISGGLSAQTVSDLIKQTRQPFWKQLSPDARLSGLEVILSSMYNLLYAYGLVNDVVKKNKRHGTMRNIRRIVKRKIK